MNWNKPLFLFDRNIDAYRFIKQSKVSMSEVAITISQCNGAEVCLDCKEVFTKWYVFFGNVVFETDPKATHSGDAIWDRLGTIIDSHVITPSAVVFRDCPAWGFGWTLLSLIPSICLLPGRILFHLICSIWLNHLWRRASNWHLGLVWHGALVSEPELSWGAAGSCCQAPSALRWHHMFERWRVALGMHFGSGLGCLGNVSGV